MMRSYRWLLLSLSAVSLPALAAEQGFDNFLLSSPSIMSPSQFYQVKGGRFEALAGMGSGSVEAKPSGASADTSLQSLAVGYAQGLMNNQMVLAADTAYDNSKMELNNRDFKDTETTITPTLALSVTPMFSLGAALHIVSGESDNSVTTESVGYNTFTVGGTLHQDAWEGSVAVTTKNKDDDKQQNASPQIMSLHGRYKVMPTLALGLRLDQTDYPGVALSGANAETEAAYSLILESSFSEVFGIEVAFQSSSNTGGEKGADATLIHLAGQYKLAPNLDLGAQVRLYTEQSDTSDMNLNSYALTLTARI